MDTQRASLLFSKAGFAGRQRWNWHDMVNKLVGPDARIDAAEVGFTAKVPQFYNDDDPDWTEAIAGLGHSSTPKSKASDGYEQVSLNLETELGHEAGLLRIDIHARRDGDDLVFGDKSKIQLNGMIMLRAEIGPDICGPCAISGKANVVGTQHRGAALTERQLQLLGQAVEYALDALVSAFPGMEPGNIWLKRAEACRDVPALNAVIATRVLQHATLYGAISRQLDLYRRVDLSDDEGVPSLSFFTHGDGPISKIYPKTLYAVRLEISCKDRKLVRMLLDEAATIKKGKAGKRSSIDRRAEFSATGAERLFLHFLHAAVPRLDQLEAHADAALASEVSIGQLLTGLISLLDRAAGHQKRKGPPSPDAQAVAIEAVESLLSGGMFDCSGPHARTAIRKDLDALCSDTGPLSKHPHRSIYYLKPQFARACGKMRGLEGD